MGISFKISKTGRRLRPKLPPLLQFQEEDPNGDPLGETVVFKPANISAIISSILCKQQIRPDYEVSFTLNLLPDGFFIGKPGEAANIQKLLQDDQRLLHPYNRVAETLFSAIELGCLPGDILDDIPSKYYNGAIVCEVCDYRNAKEGSTNGVPAVKKVLLRMSLENIVKDVPSISDDSWTYGDFMELESRALKVLRPKLCLDPKPMLDRLCPEPASDKLNLRISGFKRTRPAIDVTVASNSQTHGKKVSIDRVRESASFESADLGNTSAHANLPLGNENSNMQPSANAIQRQKNPVDSSLPGLPLTPQSQCKLPSEHLRMQDNMRIGAVRGLDHGSQVALQSMINSYADSASNGKRDAQEAQLMNFVGSKRAKQAPIGQEGSQKQSGLHIDSTKETEMWRNMMLQRQLEAKGIQYPSGISSHRPPMGNDILNVESGASFLPSQQGIRSSIKQEQTDNVLKVDRSDTGQLKSTLQVAEGGNSQVIPQQLRPHPLTQQQLLMRSTYFQQPWNSPITAAEKEIRKDDMLPKRKAAQSPRPGALVQSPVSSKSGEFSVASVFASQKEKATVISSTVAGTTSAASSPSDSLQRIPHAPTGKGKKGSIPKAAHTVGGVASPASVSNISGSVNVSSPSMVASPMITGESAVIERFSKIELINQRYQLNNKKIRAENINVAKSGNYSAQEVAHCLLHSLNVEDFTDSPKMSGLIFGGTVNTCKTRVVKSVRSHVYQGNTMVLPSRSENRLLMTERPPDGTVSMHYGDFTEESDNSFSQDCLFLLPNVYYADLLADQYISLMRRDGYQILEDQVQPITKPFLQACGNPFLSMSVPPDNPASEGHKSENISGQHSTNVPNNNTNQQGLSQSISSNARTMPPGNNQGLQIPQGYLPSGQNLPTPRAQQSEQGLLQQQQGSQQQTMQSQIQQLQMQNPSSQLQQQQTRPSSMLQMSNLSQFIGQNPNLQMGGTQMVNRASQIQLQALQQAQQQQFPRKPVIGIGAAAMGLGNNTMGLGSLGNVMSMGGVRGISSPVAPMAGLTNMGPNQMNLGSAANFNVSFRPGSIPATQSAMLASKMRMAQNRANLFAAQSGMAGLPGNTGQVLPNTTMSMLNQALNRPNVNPLQRTVMSTMAPPKISGANMYMTPQQLQLQQQFQLQQMQQQHQLQQMQQQEQQMSLPLQQVGSPSMVGSPAMSMQPQISTQPMSQQTVSPQQLSAGALQQMNINSIAGPGPASPQLSSQTHVSIGSISGSPMEQLQGANKGGSMNTGQ